MKLNPDMLAKLLDFLGEIPNVERREIRDQLTFSLPKAIVMNLQRPSEPSADLMAILMRSHEWGILEDGSWATDVLIRNAVRITRGSALESRFELFRQEFQIATGHDVTALEPEAITGETNWIMPARFLSIGAIRAKAVARLKVNRFFQGAPDTWKGEPRSGVGTGWMIAPGLLVTNEHVINARFKDDDSQRATESDRRLQAESTVAWFGYIESDEAAYSEYRVTKLERVNLELDYALLRLSSKDHLRGVSLDQWGTLPIEKADIKPRRGDPLNIIQHPNGDFQQVSLRRNDYLRDLKINGRFLYLTDTRPGSSGSPVFHDEWKVVGIHRGSIKVNDKSNIKGEAIKYNNEGVWISNILFDISDHLKDEIDSHQKSLI